MSCSKYHLDGQEFLTPRNNKIILTTKYNVNSEINKHTNGATQHLATNLKLRSMYHKDKLNSSQM